MNFENLRKFDLQFPGLWIDGQDREWAAKVRHSLGLVQNLFIEAVASFALFRPITEDNVLTRCEETPYERSLNGLYAKSFVFALNSIEKLLYQLSNFENLPNDVRKFYDVYKSNFGHLKFIRDSAIHIEDRGRGVTRHQQKINTDIIVLSGFSERCFVFTGEDGQQYEIDISETTLEIAREIIQNVINSYSWF